MDKIGSTRILTAEMINKMPLHNLKRYLKSIMRTKQLLRDHLVDMCCEICREVISEHEPTEAQVKMIKTLDWLTARVKERIAKLKA